MAMQYYITENEAQRMCDIKNAQREGYEISRGQGWYVSQRRNGAWIICWGRMVPQQCLGK